jgi:arylsulfatase A-like enzyme
LPPKLKDMINLLPGLSRLLKVIALGAFFLAFSQCLLKKAIGSEHRAKPNVLFIAIDDLNDWVNCLGGRAGVKTPNLDRLAARGVLFTNAHCTAPSCNPSRASLLTGIRPSTSGVYVNNQNWRRAPVLRHALTIPRYFRGQGYRSIGGGKIFHAGSWMNACGRDGFNDDGSWDSYFPSPRRAMPDEIRPQDWPVNGLLREAEKEGFENLFAWKTPTELRNIIEEWKIVDWAPLKEREEEMADSKVVNWAVAELGRKHEKPWFLGVGIFRPHVPWYVPRKYFDLYPINKIALPPVRENDLDDTSPVGQGFVERKWHRWIVKNNQWKQGVQGYLASISFTDALVGRLLDALDKSSDAKYTIIVLWSDNGMHLGEKEHWEKFTLWEESTRVPLIIIAPGVTHPGGRCSRPVSLLDIYPTLIELCGLQPKSELEGRSLVPLLVDPRARWDRPAVTTWRPNNHAVRSERWRYIRYHDGSEELYDHEKDPDEFTNLARDKQYEAVKKELAGWLPKINAALTPPVENEHDILCEIEAEMSGGR